MEGDAVVVKTKEELERAIREKVRHVVVKGKLAEKLNRAESIKKLSTRSLCILGAALAAIPLTGGVSAPVSLGAVAVSTGMSITSILAVSFLGLALIISITKDYDKKFYAKADGYGEAYMELNKR